VVYLSIMSDFNKSAWADNKFTENYLDKADIYIVERRKMFWYVSSLFRHFFAGRKNIKLLDIGCGDGVLTEELLRVDSAISATLIDGNEGMLQRAKGRLNSFQNVSFIRASFQEILAGTKELGNYDLCVSSMAIHHLDMDEKAFLFRKILSCLNDEGHFIDIDVVRPPSEELESWYFAIWRDWLGHMMDRYNVKDEVPEDLIKRYKDPSSMNKPDILGSQLKALSEAGFLDVDCYFKDGIFVVFGGKK
jgi:tRNA (cmo5U34)-methyltransferase